jgi:hypothetical protein
MLKWRRTKPSNVSIHGLGPQRAGFLSQAPAGTCLFQGGSASFEAATSRAVNKFHVFGHSRNGPRLAYSGAQRRTGDL